MATTSQQIVVTIGGVPTVLDVDANLWGTGTLAQRPGSGDNVGDIYIVQDGGASPPLYRIDVWNGSAWVAATTKGPSGGSTDNAVVRFDGTSGTILNNSVVTIDDSGNLTGVGTINGATIPTLSGPMADVLTRWSEAESNTLQGSGIGLNDSDQLTSITTASFVDVALGIPPTTVDWNLSASQWGLLSGNTTLTFTAPPAGTRVMLRVIQDRTGSRTVTWPSTVRWLGGSAPTLSTTAGDVDIVTFFWDGYTYWGSHAGATAWNLMQEIADAHNSHVFWPHDETSGTTAEDLSGNNDDGTYASATVNQAGQFHSDLKSVSGGNARITNITDSPTNVLTVISAHNLSAKNSVFDIRDASANRCTWLNVSGTLNLNDGSNRSSGRTTASTTGRAIVEGFTYTSSTSFALYENGCKWRDLTVGTTTGYSTPTVAHGCTYLGANSSTGNYSFFGVFGKRLSEDEHYAMWLRLTGQKHFWHEFIRAEGLTGSCVQYLPLWETGAATQLIDLSGNLRHGTATSSPTLGVTPLDKFHIGAILSAGTAYITTNNTEINVSTTTAWTIAGLADPDADGDGIFCFGGTNNIIGLCTVATATLRLYASDGSATTQDITTPSGIFAWCVRRNGNTLDWWINGILQTSISLASKSFSSNTTHVLMGWGGAHSIGALSGYFQHRGTYNAALTDAQCSALGHIDLENQYPVA